MSTNEPWAILPAGQKESAERSFWAALGFEAEAIMKRMNRDPEYVAAIANFARAQILNETVKNLALPASHTRAREIMGKNFFGIEEAVKYFGVSPTEAELKTMENIPFSEETLEACKDTHILVADLGLSILDVRKKAKQLFPKQQNWYKGEQFARIREKAQWRLVRKTPVERSFSKSYEEQKALLDSNEENPSARVLTYTTIGHFLSTGERLFEKCFVRTSDVDSDGRRVSVGGLGSDGFGVYYDWDDYRNAYLGLGSARLPENKTGKSDHQVAQSTV